MLIISVISTKIGEESQSVALDYDMDPSMLVNMFKPHGRPHLANVDSPE